MIIWDKNFIKPAATEGEPIEAPFSMGENAETVIIEIEDKPEQGWSGKGFGWSS
jgi:hypothetical protein